MAGGKKKKKEKALRILIVAPEIFPQVKVGGLGQFVAGINKALKKNDDLEVRLIVPCSQQPIYGPLFSPTTHLNFKLLAQKAWDYCLNHNWWPEILWVHDWAGIWSLKRFRNLKEIKKVWTIHSPVEGNFSYGYYDYEDYENDDEPIDWSDHFFDFAGLVKQGVDWAEAVNTVSQSYAHQLRNSFLGENCQIEGIANGIDSERWDPKKDQLIGFKLNGSWPEFKYQNKRVLQEIFGLPKVDVPLFAFVSRLVKQKGVDLLLEVLPQFLGKNKVQFVLVGQGSKKYHCFFQKLKIEFPQKLGIRLRADFDLPHQVFAGADFLVLPSLAEPGGIVVQEALVFGCLPIVHLTGGLKDQVKEGKTGLGFEKYSGEKLGEKLKEAMALWASPKIWQKRQSLGFVRSWEMVARDYLEWFSSRLGTPF